MKIFRYHALRAAAILCVVVFMILQPFQLGGNIVAFAAACRNAHHESVPEHVNDGTFEFAEVIDLRNDAFADLDVDRGGQRDPVWRQIDGAAREDATLAVYAPPIRQRKLPRNPGYDANVVPPVDNDDVANLHLLWLHDFAPKSSQFFVRYAPIVDSFFTEMAACTWPAVTVGKLCRAAHSPGLPEWR